jgi:hypothetical protein
MQTMPTRLADITRLGNGASFYTADLHVHSYGASADVIDATMTVESIIDTAVKDGISVLAITDHNTDRNTEKSLEYAAKYSGRLLLLLESRSQPRTVTC